MLDLDLTMRTPGRVLMLERRHAQALVDRAFEERRGAQGGNLLTRALGAVARLHRPQADADIDAADRTRLALPQIAWAGSVEWGEGYAIVDGVAVIDITGVMTPDGYYDWWDDCWVGGYAQIASAVATARADERVRALFLRVNSPGGLVDGCFDLAEQIAAGNGAAGGKPVWVHARMACSAAYALAASADRIVASAESDVGSIGVLVLHADVSAWYAEHGLKIEAIQSGARKTDGAEWKPLSADARAHLQGVVDQIARRFFATVSAGRGLSVEAIAALEAQWFLAAHDDPAMSGLALGLVDAIAPEAAAFAALTQSLTAGGAPGGTGSQTAPGATRATSTTETEMSLKDQIAALRGKAAKGDAAALAELKSMGVSLKAAAEDAPAEDDTDKTADAADDEEDKQDGGADEGEEGETDETDDGEPKPAATGTKPAFALLRSKEAKGRNALANRLAEKVAAKKLTYGEAKEMLADAPKARPLADAMANRDHNPGADHGEPSKAGAGLGAAIDRMNAKKTGTR